jgi:predicted permease
MNVISSWLQRRRLERELAEEMQEHLEEKVAQFQEEGYSEDQARSLARLQFGNMSLQREDSREVWGWPVLEQFWQDLQFGWRMLTKAPAFTLTAVSILALGIGLNTAMFSAVKAVLLSALPYPQPERIVELRQSAKDGHLMNVSTPDFRDWRTQSKTMASMATYGVDTATLSGSFPARRIRAAAVGVGFFDVLATQANIGRTFGTNEQQPGGPSTLVLSYELGASLFGTSAEALQKVVRLNGMDFTVIGILPPRFSFPDTAQLWVPGDLFPDDTARSAHNNRVIGRLKPGITLRQAQADMDLVAARLSKAYLDDKNYGIRVIPLLHFLTASIQPALWTLLGAVAMVLLIACVNLSNLQLARAANRRKEMSMRGALGAPRSRLIRQLLTENLSLAGLGGIAGLALAAAAVRFIRALAPHNIPRIENLQVDFGVLCFTGVLSILTGLAFGVLPSIQSSKADVNDALRQGAGKGEGVHQKRWSGALVVAQIALAVILLSGAALLLRSYWNLVHVNTGLDSSGVYVTGLTWPTPAIGTSVDGNHVRQAGREMLRRIRELPGVDSVAFVYGQPFDFAPDGAFEIEGRPLPADPHMYPDAEYRMISPAYFTTLKIPVLKGRDLADSDSLSGQQVAIVNQSFTRQFFPGADPLGQRIRFMGFDHQPKFMTIIGVIPDLRQVSMKEQPSPEVYADYFQHADVFTDITLVVRGPASLHSQLSKIVTALNHDTAVTFERLNDLISGSLARERLQTMLLILFAACALLLAVVGIYGLLSYTVTRRVSEIGVRMALGATSGRISGVILRHAGMLVALGLVIGLSGALLASRLLMSLLYEVQPADPFVLASVVGIFSITAFAASYLPARRASKINPLEALRTE